MENPIKFINECNIKFVKFKSECILKLTPDFLWNKVHRRNKSARTKTLWFTNVINNKCQNKVHHDVTKDII